MIGWLYGSLDDTEEVVRAQQSRTLPLHMRIRAEYR